MQGLGFKDVGFRVLGVQGSGSNLWALEVWGSVFRGQCLGFSVPGLGSRVRVVWDRAVAKMESPLTSYRPFPALPPEPEIINPTLKSADALKETLA